MFKLNVKFDVDSFSTCSVSLNATATQYTCSLYGIYRPHWLVQWSCHCSLMGIPVSLAARLHRCHANRSCYMNNAWPFPRQISYVGTLSNIYLNIIHPFSWWWTFRMSPINSYDEHCCYRHFLCISCGLYNTPELYMFSILLDIDKLFSKFSNLSTLHQTKKLLRSKGNH